MSEQLHNTPEQNIKPLYDDCLNCDAKYELNNKNTVGRLYLKQPDCNFLICTCPECGNKTRIFCNENTLGRAALSGITVFDDELYAEEQVYSDWVELKGIKLPETHQLTHRHEKLVGQFATSLAETPDNHLYDLIVDTGYNRPYPARWI